MTAATASPPTAATKCLSWCDIYDWGVIRGEDVVPPHTECVGWLGSTDGVSIRAERSRGKPLSFVIYGGDLKAEITVPVIAAKDMAQTLDALGMDDIVSLIRIALDLVGDDEPQISGTDLIDRIRVEDQK